jgi:hypothetical protein
MSISAGIPTRGSTLAQPLRNALSEMRLAHEPAAFDCRVALARDVIGACARLPQEHANPANTGKEGRPPHRQIARREQ